MTDLERIQEALGEALSDCERDQEHIGLAPKVLVAIRGAAYRTWLVASAVANLPEWYMISEPVEKRALDAFLEALK